MSNKIIISGGGTGGHIFPAIAIANALTEIAPSTQVLFVGAKGKMEMKKVPQAGYQILALDIHGFNRSNLLKNWNLPFKIWKASRDASKILNDFGADAAVGVGGYASFPLLRMAQKRKLPTFIQEQNAFAGKSNKILGKKAHKIFTAFEDMSRFFDPARTLDFGNPVRSSIYENFPDRETAVKYFDLDPSKKTISVVGGSLGARSINLWVTSQLRNIAKLDVQMIWQTGEGYHDEARAVAANYPNVVVVDFIRKIQMLYRAGDVIISRAGAMAIAELQIMARPVVFVPFPYAAEDHQRFNAQNLVDHDAAAMVLDANIGTELMPVLKSILEDENKRNLMSQNIEKLAVRDADKKIATEILNEING